MRSYLSGLIGNTELRDRLGKSIDSAKLPHALLIDGPEGSGKMTLAKEIAAALNCESKGSSVHLPCHNCNSCRRISEGIFADVKLLEKQEDKATLGVNEIKQFRQDMYLSSTESDYKVYIIDDAEKMTVEAQNALLIILEEPPKNVVILLLTNGTDRILTTIKSRAQYVPMSRFTKAELTEHLKRISPEASRMAASSPEAFAAIINSSDGCIGRSLELLDPKEKEKNEEMRSTVLSAVSALSSKVPYSKLYSAIISLPQKRPELNDVFENVMKALRDMICAKRDADSDMRFFIGSEEALEYASAIGHKRIFKIFDIICKAHEDNNKNANITAMLVNLAAQLKMA